MSPHASQFEEKSDVRQNADNALVRSGLWSNPYFETLRNGRMTLEVFRASQEQFYFAVVFFSRPMSGLLARLPDYASRLAILRNVVEEHGALQLGASHGATFRQFLETLGSSEKALEDVQAIPAVEAFNSVLFSACLLAEIELGIACIGVIEHAFARLSAQLGEAVVDRGWVRPELLVHYSTHATLDVQHASELFALLEPLWPAPEKRALIKRGHALGAYAFDRLYRDLLAAAVATHR